MYKTLIRNKSEAVTLRAGRRQEVTDATGEPVVDDDVTIYAYIPSRNGDIEGENILDPVIIPDSEATILKGNWILIDSESIPYEITEVDRKKIQGCYYYHCKASKR
jgi:hypothetical protein